MVHRRTEEELMKIPPSVTYALKFIVSIVLLAGLVWYVDFHAVIHSIGQAALLPLMLGTLLVIGNVGLQFYRWRYLLRLLSHDVKNGEILASLLIGFSAGFFTPAQVGEFGGRLATLRSLRGTYILGLSLIDRLSLLAVTVLLGCIAIPIFFLRYLPVYWNTAYSYLALAVALLFLLFLLFPAAAKLFLGFLPKRIREHRFYAVFEIFETTFHAPQARRLFFMTLAFVGIVALQFHFFINAFTPADLDISLICAPSIIFVKSFFLPISVADLGVRETTAVFFYSKAGIPGAAALNASLCVFTVNVLLPSIAGVLYLLKLKIPRTSP